jgi:DNA-binding SARP family transcriptional activator
LFREVGDQWGIALSLNRLGNGVLCQGDCGRAAALYAQSLKLRRELGDKDGIASCLEGLARLACAEHQPERAARLFGAAEVLREAIHAPLPPAERRQFDCNVTTVRARLGEAVFAAAWKEGRAMTLEQGIEYALTRTAMLGPETTALPTAKPAIIEVKAEAELRIFALGSTRVLRGERELASSDWKYAKTREMFFYLLCYPSRTKEQIGVALWPDASPAQLRSNFRVALYHLRRALGCPEWILFENDQYTFNRSRNYWFDVEAFEFDLAEARRVSAEGQRSEGAGEQRAQAIQYLEQAVELYQGEFLEGWREGEWYWQRQQELQRKYLEALLALGQLLFAEGRYSQAADVYRRAIVADSYLEVAHRELMRCYARQGDRGQALQHYQELGELMRDELGA